MTLPAGVTSEMVEAAWAKFTQCCNAMTGCPTCQASGTIGDDWCPNCGGCQYVPEYPDDKVSMREAITAALTGLVVDDLTEQQIIDRERSRCARICELWINTFKDKVIQYTSARDYAVDAINDIIDLITDGQPLPAPPAMLAAAVEGEG